MNEINCKNLASKKQIICNLIYKVTQSVTKSIELLYKIRFRDYIFYADSSIGDDIVRKIMQIMFTMEVVTRYPHWKVLIEPFFSIKQAKNSKIKKFV